MKRLNQPTNQDALDWRHDWKAMLSFAQRWEPYGGGGASDIWLNFGVTERMFFRRLAYLLTTPHGTSLDEATYRRLRRLCTRRLAPRRSGGSPPIPKRPK